MKITKLVYNVAKGDYEEVCFVIPDDKVKEKAKEIEREKLYLLIEEILKRNEKMREIEFRGKRKDNGEWIYGNYEYYHKPTKHIISNPYTEETKGVIPKTIGQYTGLKDKNDKKIFEGDIIKIRVETLTNEWDIIGVVKYYNASYGIAYENDQHFLAFNKTSSNVRWYEVIGNLYDNKELLEVE